VEIKATIYWTNKLVRDAVWENKITDGKDEF
jgi:hypothetical protein